MDVDELMRLAIAKTQTGIAAGQSPFGCAIARGDEVLAVAHNTVLGTVDSTAHAEVNAVREANRRTGQIFLEGATVATTCEPCPMCMAALHWARVETVYFGASIAQAAEAGFNELHFPARQLLDLGSSPVKLVAGLQAEACVALFDQWAQGPSAQAY